MSVGKYIGSRYIPKAAEPILHNSANAYEHLMMVQDAQGGCWMSTKPVPPGIPLEAGEYWMFISDWDAQVAEYHAEVQRYGARISNVEDSVEQTTENLAAETQARETADATIREELAAETQARETADAAIREELAAETQARETADATIREELAAETQARETSVNEIESDNWVTTRRIENNAITYDKLSVALQNRNSSIDMLTDIEAYIDGVNGNDETAVLGNRNRPFQTLNAAFKASDERGNNFRFNFLRGGVYTWTMRVMVGAVVHFFTSNATSGVTVNIDNGAPAGGVFFYDTHLGCYGTEAAPLTLVAPQYIEIEGGTLWCSGKVNFDMAYLYLIDGSGQLAHVTMTRGYILGRFGNIVFDDLIINNREAHAAFDWSCGVLRCQGDSVKIGRNSNGSNQTAIVLRSCLANFNSDTGVTTSNIGYQQFMHCYTGVTIMTDSLLAAINGYASTNSVIETLRIRDGSVIG